MTPFPSPSSAVRAAVDELEGLLQKATPGPWALHPDVADEILGEFKPSSGEGDYPDYEGIDVALCRTPIPGTIGGDSDKEFANAALIVAMHRALPHLLAAIKAVDELHRPWYEINGRRYENLVSVPCDQFTGCAGTDKIWCGEGEDGHEVPACSECRYVVDGDIEGYLLWPCPTVKALRAALALAAVDVTETAE